MNHHQAVVGGIRLHYLEQGSGEPLLLLHGTAIDSASLSFAPSISSFAQQFRVIAPDWPGYGESENPRRILKLSEYAELLEKFVQTLGMDRFHLLGFSMGGAVAIQYALKHPRLLSLILVSSYGLGRRLHIPLLPYLALRVPRLAGSVLLGLRMSKTLTGAILRYLIFARSQQVTPELVDQVYAQLKKPYVEEAFMQWIRSEVGAYWLRSHFQRELSHLEIPTLLIHGSNDKVIPASNSVQASQKIPAAQLQIIKNCGHWVMREQPQAFEEKTLTFLLKAQGQGKG